MEATEVKTIRVAPDGTYVTYNDGTEVVLLAKEQQLELANGKLLDMAKAADVLSIVDKGTTKYPLF